MSDFSTMSFVLANPTNSAFRFILEQYLAARAQQQRFGAAHPLWGYFRTLTRFLSSTSPVERRQPNLDVAWSLGQGRWASVPWVACLDRRDTTTTQRSIYVVYLFREDMSGVYLTLNQGVTFYTQELGQVEGRAQLRTRAAELRTERAVRALLSHGFSLDNAIDLRTEAYRGLAYQAGTIAHKLYSKDELPLDEALEADLERALQAYYAYLDKTDAIKAESSPAGQAAPQGAPATRTQRSGGQPARKVFVSHSHTDNEFCRAFVAALRGQGADVWYDEQGLSAGSAWVAKIQQELESREVFVLVATPAAWASEWVQEELQLAFIQRRQIIPVLHQQTQMSGMILSRQWIDAVGLTPQEAADRVSAQLAAAQQSAI